MSVIALTPCRSYDLDEVRGAVRAGVAGLGGMGRFVRPGQRVLLKPNLLGAHPPERCVSTAPAVVRATAELVLAAGGRPLIADSPALDPFRRVARLSGIQSVADELGIPVQELGAPRVAPAPAEARVRRLELASQALDADVIINLPKLKTHSQMLLTLGVKNLFGCVVAQRKAEWHYMTGLDRDAFAALLLDIYLTLKPALTILDGVQAMEGRGPANGRPRAVGLLAAAEDPLDLDLALCDLLRVPRNRFPLFRAAQARELLARRPPVRFAGPGPDTFAITDFDVPHLDSMEVLPAGMGWMAKRFLISRPVQEPARCEACGRCVEICPPRALELVDRTLVFDYDRCIRCYCCQEVCPADAIGFRQGWLQKVLHAFKR